MEWYEMLFIIGILVIFITLLIARDINTNRELEAARNNANYEHDRHLYWKDLAEKRSIEEINCDVKMKLNTKKRTLEIDAIIYIDCKDCLHEKKIFDLDLTEEHLKEMLAEIRLKNKYPLAYEIKYLDCEFVELYIDGQFYEKCTKDYAWKYVKQYGKNKEIIYKEE